MARKETQLMAKPSSKALSPKSARKVSNVVEPPVKAVSKPRGRAAAVNAAGVETNVKSASKVSGKASVAQVSSPVVPSRKGGKASIAKAPPPVLKPAMVTLKHLASELAQSRELDRKEAEGFAFALMGKLIDQVKDGAKVKIAGLGTFEIRDLPARMVRNPATGSPVLVEASRKLVFRLSRSLKSAI